MKTQISNILSNTGISAADKVLLASILLYPSQGVRELGRYTGMNPSQASRRLRHLAQTGLVVMQVDGKNHSYRLA